MGNLINLAICFQANREIIEKLKLTQQKASLGHYDDRCRMFHENILNKIIKVNTGSLWERQAILNASSLVVQFCLGRPLLNL